MARPLTDISCPSCRKTRTSHQVKRSNPKKLERYYECRACLASFTTVETVSQAPLDRVLVKGPVTPDNPNPKAEPYNPDTIERHLRGILKKVLTERQRMELIEVISAEMPRRLKGLPRLEDHEDPHTSVIEAEQVRRVIEECLFREARRVDARAREHYETAHALYMMTAVRQPVTELLDKLASYYPAAIVAATPTPVRPPEAQLWHYPEFRWAPNPTQVVKNFRPGDEVLFQHGADTATEEDRAALRQRRPRAPFQLNKFDRSIARALVTTQTSGPGALTTRETVHNVREWVLWELAGQPVVRSSQLSTLTAGVLRRASPISYLRWVTLGKELSVGEIHEEGCALLTQPSVPLRFARSAAVTLTPSLAPQIAPSAGQPVDL